MSSNAAMYTLQGVHTALMHITSLFDTPESDLAMSTDGHIATLWKHDQGIPSFRCLGIPKQQAHMPCLAEPLSGFFCHFPKPKSYLFIRSSCGHSLEDLPGVYSTC